MRKTPNGSKFARQTLDNRSGPNKHELGHFWFNARGKRIAYCYIRKNACTAFKQIICETSSQANFSEFEGNQMTFMGEHHRLESTQEIMDCNERIFVYRDPNERLISLYINKFVSRDQNDHIFRRFEEETNLSPDKASFRDFVMVYCREPFELKDPHVRPLEHHLARVKYTWAIPMSELSAAMEVLLGRVTAKQYFSVPTNSTSYGSDADSLFDQPSCDLRQRLLKSGKLPSKRSMMDKELEQVVRQRYSCDYELVERLEPYLPIVERLRRRLFGQPKHS